MTKPLTASGLPRGTGSLQIRGRVYWMIYTDETGRNVQANTETADFAEARRLLVRAAMKVLRARLAALRGILNEDHDQPAARAGAARGQGAHRAPAPAHARNRQKNSQGGSR